MPVKVSRAPRDIPAPVIDYANYNAEKHQAAEAEFIAKLREYCRSAHADPEEAIGEVIRTPRCDGYAEYMVFSLAPCQLIHLPLGDAWHADPIWLNGLNAKIIREKVRNSKDFLKPWQPLPGKS